jgi:dihydrofolate reductase
MAHTVYYTATSLDGFIATEDDNLDWLTKYQGSFSGEGARTGKGGYDRFYAGVGALVSGSTTYEWVLDHIGEGDWPYKGKPCWILSSRELPKPAGAEDDVRIVDAPVADLYEEMSAAAGDRALWIVGGGDVASQFAEVGLLDEASLTVVPVVLGAGKPLFSRPLPGGAMQLLEAHPYDSGMVGLRYEVAPASAS